MYIAGEVSANNWLESDELKRIFLRAVTDHQSKSIDDTTIAAIAYELLEVYSSPKAIYQSDKDLGSILHDTQELADANEVKRDKIYKILADYTKV